MARRSRAGFRAAWRAHDYRLILAASTASQTGDWLYNVALLVWVYDATHSAGWVALMTVARLAPYPLFGPLGGLVADTFDRRRVLITSDLLRVALMGALALVTVADGSVVLAAAIAFATTVCGTAYRPAVVAMLPDIVGERALAAANATESVVENLAVVAGPMIGAGLLAIGSPSMAFAVNGLTFLVSALLACGLRTQSRGRGAGEHAIEVRWSRRIARGFHELGRSADARVLSGYMVGTSFIYGAQTVMLVIVASSQHRGGTDGVGILYAALGAGGIAGAAIVSRIARSARVGTVMFAALALNAVPMAVLATTNGAAIIFTLVLLSGVGMVVVDVLCLTQLQRAVPGEVLGRVWGALDALTVLAMIVGSLLVGPTITVLGTDAAFATLMLAVPTLGLLGVRGLFHADREAAVLLDRIGPVVTTLETLPIFEDADRSVIERLALAAIAEELAIGTDAVVQGEPARDFYVVRHGRFDVYRIGTDGETTKVGLLSGGDWFGEVGLLHDEPRNATVRARWPSAVWRIPGTELLEALSDAPTVAATLREGVASRLASDR